MIAALTLLSLLVLLLAVPGCLVVGVLLLWWAIFAPWGRDLAIDRASGYRLPPTVHRSPSTAHRQCPQWLLVASGKAVRRV